jgi:hypothetical protein
VYYGAPRSDGQIPFGSGDKVVVYLNEPYPGFIRHSITYVCGVLAKIVKAIPTISRTLAAAIPTHRRRRLVMRRP